MTIEQRVAKLERQNRWMKRVGGLMLAAVACVVLVAQGAKPKVHDLVAAKRFVLHDETGKIRAALMIDKVGKETIPVLWMGTDWKRREVALAGGSVPQFTLSHPKLEITHMINPDGTPLWQWLRIVKKNEEEVPLLMYQVDNQTGLPLLFYFDADGKPILKR